MYIQHEFPSTDSPELKSTSIDLPDLSATPLFWKLLQTLPASEPVPPAIISFGLLIRQLEPYAETVTLDRNKISVVSPRAVVPPETLRAVRYILAKQSSELSSADKESVGQLCELTELNRQPEDGDNIDDVIKSAKKQNPIDLNCFCSEDSDTDYSCPNCSKSYRSQNALSSHKKRCSSTSDDTRKKYECPKCEKKFKKKQARDKHKKNCKVSNSSPDLASGKTIKKDNRGERIAGKNPFADSDRLKDTGLHQGGG